MRPLLKQRVSYVVAIMLAATALGQTPETPWPTNQGMYVQTADSFTKIIGQIAEFKRSGSLLVSAVTVGIKSQKANIQLLGPHAQTVVSPQPVFCFIPAKQEAEAGVNAGDLILIRLEEKSHRRQFEIAAAGLWRASSGISLTHQIQVFRSEAKPGVYTITPATELARGEYALFLSRGEGMAPYVYDFGVGGVFSPVITREAPRANVIDVPERHSTETVAKPSDVAATPTTGDPFIGVLSDGNPHIRHDGVVLTSVTEGSPADHAGIRPGDTILAINDHYLFTTAEMQDEISHYKPGTSIRVRYRRYSTIYDVSLVVGSH